MKLISNNSFCKSLALLMVVLMFYASWPRLFVQEKTTSPSEIAPRKKKSKEIDNKPWKSRVWNKTTADDIINTYIHNRKLGYTRERIALKIFQARERLPHLDKHHCYPFVCDHTLRAYAHVIIERDGITSRKHPSQMDCGDVVYVDGLHYEKQFTKIVPEIKVPFVLVTGRSDQTKPQRTASWTDVLESPLLIKWYTINPSPVFASHPKLAGLPIGIRSWGVFNQIDAELMKGPLSPVYSQSLTAEDKRKRHILVYMNYDLDKSHQDRPEMTWIFKDIGTYHPKLRNPSKYLEHVAKSKFVLSPRGEGMDCYRTYEAILLQAIPIVQDLSPRLTDIIRLAPAFVLPADWMEFVANRTEFENFEADNALGRSVVLADYWFDQIEAVREDFVQGNGCSQIN